MKDYIEEGEVSSSIVQVHQEEAILSDATKDQLQLMLPHLEQDIADLVHNAGPIRDIFLAIRGELGQELLDSLSPAAFIDGHQSRVTGAKKRLADREAQKNLDSQEEASKQEMVNLKQIIDNLNSAPLRIQQELDQLRTEREQL